MKKALSAVLAVVLVLGVCFSVPMIASANDANDFTYRLNEDGDGYIITGVKNVNNVTGEVTIPKEYTLKSGEGFDEDGNVVDITNPTNALSAEEPVVTFTAGENGTITATAQTGEEEARPLTSGDAVVAADKVVFTVVANAGYKVGTFTVNSEAAELTENTYTIDAIDNDVTVAVTFVVDETQTFDVTVPAAANGCSVTAEPAAAYVGQTVTLTIETAEGYQLDAISAGEGVELTGSGATRTFTMPAKDVDVTATFSPIPATKYAINITAENGTVTAKIGDETVTSAEKNAEVVLSVVPAEGYEIDEITVTPAEAYNAETKTITMPEGDVTVTATFQKVDYTITLNDVTDVITLAVPQDAGLTANYGDKVTIYVVAGADYVVKGLTIAGVEDIEAVSGTLPDGVTAGYTFTMPAADVSVSADYANKYNSVNIAEAVKNYVKVTTTADKEGKFEYNKSVTLKVTAPNGFELETLTVDGQTVSVNAQNEYTFTITKDVAVNAEFQAATLKVVGIDEGAFAGCTGITSFKLAADQTNFVVTDGVLFVGTTLLAFPANYGTETDAEETYTIPATVTKIAKNAFEALGAIDYVFYNGNVETLTVAEGNTALSETVFHKGMTTHEVAEDAEGTVTQDPNCTYTGVRTFYCKVCNVSVRTAVEPINEEAHIPGAYEVEVEGSCTVAEVKVAPCVLCDETRASVITSDIPGHTPATTKTVIESTCKTLGREFFECTTCKEELQVVNYTEYAAHVVPDENVIDEQHYKAATCEETGEKTGLCEVCGKEDAKVVIPQLEHEYEKEVISELTCTQDGLYFMVCKYCDEVDPVNPDGVTQKAEGHKASKIGDKLVWTVEKAATCSTEGLAVVKCSVCNGTMPDTETETYTRPINALGHTDDSYTWVTTKEATCTEAGVSTGTCKTCDATTTKAIPATGHTAATEWTLKTDSTCKDEGKEVLLCTVCNTETAERAVAKKPHTVDLTATGEGGTTTITQAATHFETGLCDGKCTVCGDNVEDVVIPTTPHVFTVKNAEGEDVLATAEPLRETIGEGEDAKTKPTCTDAGYVAVYCTIEGCDEYKEDTVAETTSLGHDFDATYTTENKPAPKAPTCEDDGYEYKWCKRCSDEEATAEDNYGYVKVKIDAVGHSFTRDAWVDGKANNCIESGYKAKHCSNAGCNEYDETTKVEVVASGHDYDELAWSTTAEGGKAPTCTEDGVEVNTCRIAGCPKPNLTRKVDKIAHNFTYEGAEKKTVNPTCSDEGYDYIKCNGCNEIQKSNVKSALGHDTTGNTAQVTAATCEADGVSKTACNRYFVNGVYDATANAENAEEKGAVKCAGIEVKIDALGHFYSDEYSILDKATCEEPGEKARKCIRYGEGGCTAMTGKVEIPATDHTLDTEYKVIEGKEPTCQKAGSEARHCINEGCKYYDLETVRPVATVAHDWSGEWIIEKQPTCLEDGEGLKTKVCKNCTEEKEEVMPRLEHNTTNANTQRHEPSCTEPGYTYKECQNYIEGANGPYKCGYKVKIDVLDATGHKLSADDDDTYEEQEATCTKPGYKKGTCTECNELVTIDEVEKTGHKFSAEHTKVDATCQTEGSITGKCQIDGCDGVKDANGNVTEILPVKEHSFTKYVLVEDKLCTDANALVSVCDTCIEDTEKGLEKATDSKNNEEHISSGWVVNKEATCGTAGEMTDFCSVCRHPIDSSPIPATGKHNLKEIVTDDPECTKAPTCTEKGKRKVVCQNENCIEGTDGTYTQYTAVEVVEELGHDETDWVTSVAPTCTTKGYASSICQRCLATETKILIPLGHDLGDYITDTPAACGKVGYQHKECSRCDYKTDAETIAALKHNFVGNDCANKCGAKIYEYALVEGSTTDIIITKYNGSDENLVIPAEIDDYNVVAIGDRAFMKTEIETTTTEVEGEDGETTTETTTTVKYVESDFTSLTIPASIAKIGDYAFANSKLTLVNIPATVTTIGKCAFGYDVEITMVEPDVEEGETPAEGEEVELVEKIVPTKVAGFTIYGVKPSAAETYAKQDAAEGEEYNFTFVEVKDVYDVVIDEEETNIVEVDNGVLFKEFAPVVENDDSTKIVNQIKAVIELPENSDYTVDVEATLSGVINEGEDDETPYAFYGTGSKILIKDGSGKVVDEIVVIIEGDVNGDSVVDALDCMLIQLASQDKSALEGVYLTAGDYDCDGEIEVADFSGVVNQIFGVAEDDEIDDTTTTTTESTTEGTSEESGDDNQGSGNDNQGSGDDNQGSGEAA